MSDRILLSWGWMLYGIPYFWLDGDDQTTDLLKKHLGEVSLLEDKLIENNCSMPNSNFNFNMN
ncbi:hypothetical protein [Photobacterium sanguinicancri]|uniref:hypothetical protein n=1 Tax=Photobacterium sanguinicancri TaxID=875932 RepID=UPI0024801496|nr:hypothetical protein [Photobacterium sanguinicancri]